MHIQILTLKIYNSLIKRIKRWIVFLVIGFSYLTAFLSANPNFYQAHLSSIEISTYHFLTGVMLSLLLIIMVYDLIQKTIFFKEKKNLDFNLGNFSFRKMIDYIFYIFLYSICLLGIMLYLAKHSTGETLFSDISQLAYMHRIMALFFITVALLKYYLSITLWYDKLVKYLREYY